MARSEYPLLLTLPFASWCSLISPFFFSTDKAITILFFRLVSCSQTHDTMLCKKF